MRILCLSITVCLIAAAASAQQSSVSNQNGDLSVLDKKWRSDVRIPKLERDTEKQDRERQAIESRRREIELLNDKLREQGMPVKELPERPLQNDRPAEISVSYDYQVKVKNTGNKRIVGFVWEYIFSEPNSQNELGRRKFESEVRIDRGKTRTVTVRSSLPPTETVDVSKTGNGPKIRYSEDVKIVSITYVDGGVWNASEN